MSQSSNREAWASIIDFGAVPDGQTINTASIQKAIDTVANAGGGVVHVPPGRFVSGTIFIRSYVTLELAAQAVLVASPNWADYLALDYAKGERPHRHFVAIQNAKLASLTGRGTVDGNAAPFVEPATDPNAWAMGKRERPDAMLAVINSQDILIRDVHLTNPPNWVSDIYGSDRVQVRGVSIVNDARSPNNDGIDISGSHDVIISDCHIDTGDDGIVINTRPRDVRRVLVTNCIIRSHCAALKVGWEYTLHDISQVVFSNCVLSGCNRGLAAYSCNGATLEDIAVSNIVYDSNSPVMFPRPIHLDLRKGRDTGTFGTIRNVVVSNFVARTQGRALLTSETGGFLENITIRDLHMVYPYIEDPDPIAEGAKSAQFSNPCRAARRARAAVVAENIRGLHIEGLRTTWPDKPVPASWQLPVKRENGGVRLFRPDYGVLKPAEFSLLWGRNLTGIVNAPLAAPSSAATAKYDLAGCEQLQT